MGIAGVPGEREDPSPQDKSVPAIRCGGTPRGIRGMGICHLAKGRGGVESVSMHVRRARLKDDGRDDLDYG
jgi:hypothetical protein